LLTTNVRVCAEAARQDVRDHNIRVDQLDYREMPGEWEGSFDRIVSIEMVEAVRLENVDVFWSAIDRVLNMDGAGAS
jgi:cyclopropane-fatty-acyl-phospholipid synthase